MNYQRRIVLRWFALCCAMLILIEQDQHIEPIPDFCHLCQFSGMNMENATDFSMYFGLEQYEVLNVNHI